MVYLSKTRYNTVATGALLVNRMFNRRLCNMIDVRTDFFFFFTWLRAREPPMDCYLFSFVRVYFFLDHFLFYCFLWELFKRIGDDSIFTPEYRSLSQYFSLTLLIVTKIRAVVSKLRFINLREIRIASAALHLGVILVKLFENLVIFLGLSLSIFRPLRLRIKQIPPNITPVDWYTTGSLYGPVLPLV